jgi:hypothetical protein
MTPADCHAGQQVLHAGRPCVVSAIAGDHATIAINGEFRAVPIAELTPAVTDVRLTSALRGLGSDLEPAPGWDRQVLQAIAAGEANRSRLPIVLASVVLVIAAIAAWLVLA